MHFGARFVLVPDGGAPLPDMQTIALDQAWREGVAAHDGKGGFVRSREQPLLLSLSSGTTGSPKGPMVTHGHTLSRLYIYTISLTFNEADRFITATPLYFGGARYMTMAYLFMGATVVLFPAPYQPEELARAVNDQRITSLFLVPTLLRRLLEMPKTVVAAAARRATADLVGIEPLSGGAAPDLRELCPSFFNFYSSSEGGGISLLRPEHPDEASLSVGKVVFGAEVQIIDEQHRQVPAGTVGAIRYRGGGVADSYYRNPEESATRVPRRLVLSGRPRQLRHRRLSLSHRPRQGHDHPRRREHLSGRDRADLGRASRRRRGRRGRLAVARARRGGRGLRGLPARA